MAGWLDSNSSLITRRWTSVVAAAALALTGFAVAAPSPASAASSQLLPDGGFENGNGGWAPFDKPTLTRVTSPVRSGKYAMKVTATSPTNALTGMTQNTAEASSTKGAAYTASCYVRPSKASLEVRIRLLQYTQNFGSNVKLGTTVVDTLPANTWTKVTVTGTATAAGQRIIPQIYASFQNTSSGYLVYDDCSFTRDTAAGADVATRPGPSNTGVPAGTTLKPLNPGDPAPAGTRWSGNVLWVTAAGTVLDSLDIRALVRVEAKDVVIKNSRITGQYLSSSFALIYISGDSYSVTVRDCELYAKYPSAYVRGVIGYNFTLERVNIHDVIDQMAITGDNVTVKDSWLHDSLYYEKDPTYNNTPSHDDNAQIQKGSNLKFVNNTMSGTHNAAIQVTQDAGVVSNVLIDGNHVSDGGCALNLAQKARGPLKGFTIKNNVFTRTQIHTGCAMIVDAESIPLLTLANNTWADGTAVTVTRR